jgi:lipopolysaccharide export system permease protein
MKKNKLGYYFIKEFLKNYLSLLLAFALIIWITQAVRLLDLVGEEGNSITTYFLYILTILPKIISRLSIIIFFISFIVIISKFEDQNELKALWFSGLDQKKFINYLVKFSILFVFLLILIRTFIIPYFSNYSRYLLLNSGVGSLAPLIKYNNFNNPLKKITIYVGKKNQINELEDIILFEDNKFEDNKEGKSRTIIAKSGAIINENNKNLLVLINGSIQEENNSKVSILDFDKITLDINQYGKKTAPYYKFNEMYAFELFQRIKNKDDPQILDIKKELNDRVVYPLLIPSLVILSCLLMVTNKEFINKIAIKIIIFLSGILILLISEILLNLSSKKDNITLIFFYIAPFLFFIINKLILNYFINYKKQ